MTFLRSCGTIEDIKRGTPRPSEVNMKPSSIGFSAADILLPDFRVTDGSRWAVVACDQHTSEPEYWQAVAEEIGNAPSTLSMILPEVWLSETATRVPAINAAMEETLKGTLKLYPNALIALERTQSNGSVRRGLIGMVDLECYDYTRGSSSLIRATEGTVLERIPPRVAIRRDAPLELPHILILIDDPAKTVIEPLFGACDEPLYDFDLMQGGGHVRAHLVEPARQEEIYASLAALITPEAMQEKYGDGSLAPLLFAMGDGNHSLATAKAAYEEVKASIGHEAALRHPARYALAELENLHDPALEFEPIYRTVTGCDPQALLADLKCYLSSLKGTAAPQTLTAVTAEGESTLTVPSPEQQLAVGTLQAFLSDYEKAHPEVTVDYIHGADTLRRLAASPATVGFLFDGMRKDELFRTVIYDGALPRKTFSMGHAADKRYYIECRRIK